MRVPTSALATLAFSALLLSGCQQLFTTSLGSSLARTSYSIPTNLSTSQAADLAAQAKDDQDTKLASALLSSLNTEISNTSDPATKAALEQSAAEAAVVASGAGTSVMTALSDFSNGSLTSSDVSSFVPQLQAGATSEVLQALAYLSPSASPQATVDTSAVNVTDYVLAAAVIAANALPAGVTDPTALSGVALTTYRTNAAQALDILNFAATLPGGGEVSSIISALNLS